MVEKVKTIGGKVYILRFRPIIQIGHLFLLVGMILCFFTGLSMFYKFGETAIFAGNIGKWLGLPAETTGRQLISWLHDIIGFLLMLIGVIIIIAARGIRSDSIREAVLTWKDIREFIQAVNFRFGRAKVYPKYGFYNPLQKLWVLVVAIGLILLGVSGIFLTLEKWLALRLLSDNLRQFMSLLHVIGAFIFFAGLPIHLLFSILPTNWPILTSQLLARGYVPGEWWRAHHPAHYEEVVGKREGGER